MKWVLRRASDPSVTIGTCHGQLDFGDAKEAAEAIWANPEWRGQPVVWDFREARLNLSSAEVRALAQFILAEQPSARPARVALVTAIDVDFGMARMFGVFREHPATQVRVFREFDVALLWAQSGVDPAPDQ